VEHARESATVLQEAGHVGVVARFHV